MDSFWSQEVINDWNDEYSPRKAPKAPPKSLDFQDRSLSDALFPLGKCYAKQDRTKREARKAFSQRKVKLAQQFLTELDETITDGQIEKLAADTGGVKIIWTKTLNTTAGRAKWKRETVRNKNTQPDGKSAISYRHHAAIELAEKVIDDEDRLLNVIAHEFCHLANFMISDISTNPHGKEFKGWAAKCSRHFGDRGIRVTTKHSYIIEYKYAWECTNCGIEYKRHSKSVDPARHQCGTCKGKLVQTKPVPRTTAGKASDYQTFVKENMKKVRDENPGSPQKEIMSLVGKKYQQYKASRKESEGEEERKSLEPISIEEDDGSKEGSPEDESPAVISRKLDFLALSNI
jgi:predicted SprT family Zn-dependent metalloprotease